MSGLCGTARLTRLDEKSPPTRRACSRGTVYLRLNSILFRSRSYVGVKIYRYSMLSLSIGWIYVSGDSTDGCTRITSFPVTPSWIQTIMDMSLKGLRACPKANESAMFMKYAQTHTFSGAESEKSMMGGSSLAKTRANA